MEKSNGIGVILFRDMTEEGWYSMDRYADNLIPALKRGASSRFPFSFSTFTCRKTGFIRPLRPFMRWIPFFGNYVNDLYFSRFLKYPWLAKGESKKFKVSHVLDHSYAHLLYYLESPLKVVTCHDLLPLEFEKDAAALKVFRYSLGGLKKADLILADSRDTRRDLEDKLGLPTAKIRVVPLAVDLERFRPEDERADLEGVHQLYRIPYGKIVLHVGNSLAYKNQERVLQALALLRKNTPEPVFFLKVGRLSNGQRHLAEKLGIADQVLEREAVPDEDLAYFYNLADLLIYPSLKEGFGFPVLEALACGRPVLVSRGTSLEEITGNLGVLVDPKNTEDIAQKIYEVLFRFHPALHGKGEEFRRRAEKFTWQKTAEMTLSAYEELLVSRPDGSVPLTRRV